MKICSKIFTVLQEMIYAGRGSCLALEVNLFSMFILRSVAHCLVTPYIGICKILQYYGDQYVYIILMLDITTVHFVKLDVIWVKVQCLQQ